MLALGLLPTPVQIGMSASSGLANHYLQGLLICFLLVASLLGCDAAPELGETTPVPEPGEVAEVFEVPLAYLLAPENLRQVEITHRGRVRHVLEYTWPGQRIWGATAAILYNLRRRLEQNP